MTLEQKPWWKWIGLAAGRAVLDLLFPPRCLVCGAQSAAPPDGVCICQQCRERLFPADWQTCPRCASPVPAEREAVAPCPFVGDCLAVWTAQPPPAPTMVCSAASCSR